MSHALPILFGLMLGIAALQSFGWPGVLVLALALFAWELLYDLHRYRREQVDRYPTDDELRSAGYDRDDGTIDHAAYQRDKRLLFRG